MIGKNERVNECPDHKEIFILDLNMHPQIYNNHTEDGSSSTFSLSTTANNTTSNNTSNNNSTSGANNGQDGSTIESNHSSPVWPIPSTSSSSIAIPVNTSNGSHPLANSDLFSPEPYSVAAMAVSRYADDLYMNCYSTKMNSLLLAQAATNKLNDPANSYNRKIRFWMGKIGLSFLFIFRSLLLSIR